MKHFIKTKRFFTFYLKSGGGGYFVNYQYVTQSLIIIFKIF